MQPGAEFDVEGAAALVTEERFPYGDLVTIRAKAHNGPFRTEALCAHRQGVSRWVQKGLVC